MVKEAESPRAGISISMLTCVGESDRGSDTSLSRRQLTVPESRAPYGLLGVSSVREAYAALRTMGLASICASASGAVATERRWAAAKDKAARSARFIETSWQYGEKWRQHARSDGLREVDLNW